MKNRKEMLKSYADFLRHTIKENKPTDWDCNLLGDFPGTTLMYQKYFGYILKQGINHEKIKVIDKRFKLEKYTSIEKKIISIDGKPRSIEKFFIEEIVPYEKNLKFIAIIFDSPIQSVEEYINFKKNNNQSKESLLEKEKLVKSTILPNSINKKNKRNLALISIIPVIIIILFFLHKFTNNKKDINNLENLNKHQIVQPTFFPQDIGSNLFVRKTISDINNTVPLADSIFFYTVNIFNDKGLYKNGAWSFETDPKGEDMNSKYGEPFNVSIESLFPILNGRTTIANQYMDIHFNIENQMNKTLYFSSLKINVLHTYDAVSEQAEYNMYEVRTAEIRFELILNEKNMYGFTVEKEKLKSGEAIFCRMRVTGSESSTNLIYRLQIIADLVDTKGKHYQAVSDKNYLIGFVPEN